MAKTLYSVPDGYVIIKPAITTDSNVPRMQYAMRKDILEVKLARDLNLRLARAKKGYITVKEASQRLHLDRIVDPSGHYSFSVQKIVEQHPLEFALSGSHVTRAQRTTA